MASAIITRRGFIKGAASLATLVAFPRIGQAQNTPGRRMEWQEFKTSDQYSSFLDAIRLMRANTRQNSASSWKYWTNTHVNYCPHGIPYFLAWHRGYLYHFERQLRVVTGNANLTVPYWDYYKNPRIPAEFLDPAKGNPLYVSRVGTSVYNALTLSPFSSNVYNFQRGTANAFESLIESAPHNPVHDLIGNAMATMQSPLDPIFYLHHANIDRLWHAWSLPSGKGTPYTANPYSSSNSNLYWSGAFTYASNLGVSRYLTYTPSWLGTSYSNNSMPTSLPQQALSSPLKLVQVQTTAMLTRPPLGQFATVAGRLIANGRLSLGGAANVALTDASFSARMPLAQDNLQMLRQVLGTLQQPAGAYRSAAIVADNIMLTPAGQAGGYYFNVYLNLPEGDATAVRQRFFLGTLGAFELAAAMHHGPATLIYPATAILASLDPSELENLTVSLVRVNGENAPTESVGTIGELRVELSAQAPVI